MRRYSIAILFIFCLSWLTGQAQQIHLPYFCGFEESAENQQWVLNPNTPKADDKWVIGTSTRAEGDYSLYITTHNGTTPNYGTQQNVVYAYRIIRFPEGKASYDISFDWKCQGDQNNARLMVYIGLASQLTTGLNLMQYAQEDLGKTTNILSSSNAINYFARPQKDDNDPGMLFLYGSEAWQTVSLTHSLSRAASTQDFVLLFAWENTNKDSASMNLSACIDNIQIASNIVKKPFDLRVEPHCEDSTLKVMWKTVDDWFEVQYRNVNETSWHRMTHIGLQYDSVQTVYVTVPRGIEGSYNIRVRAANEAQTDTSAWVGLNNIVYWCPDNHCVNYLDIYGDDVVCTYGRHSTFGPYIAGDTVGVVDYGEDSRASRHTVNWRLKQHDPRTEYSRDHYGNSIEPLKTIPDGAVASVRLGNWEAFMGQENITYSITVDSLTQAILLVKYAVVLQVPEPNGASGFMLRVLDENDKLVSPTCGVARFLYSDELAEEWNSSYVDEYGRVKEERQAIWKDWTTLGYDLSPYHGKTIKVQLETWDCVGGAHYGYAYYVLDCTSKKLYSETCGASEYMDIEAPVGFSYTWTNSSGQVLGTDRVLHTPAVRDVFTCTACMLADPNDPRTATDCCFDLRTEMAPRYAYPDFDVLWEPKNCKNQVRLIDKSHVILRDDNGTITHSQEACDNVEWRVHTKSDPTVISSEMPDVAIPCQATGETIYVELNASIGAAGCSETRFDTIVVGTIYSEPATYFDTICQNELPRLFNGVFYDAGGVYEQHIENFAGCDSSITYNLHVFPNSEPYLLKDTLCSNHLPYILNGTPYSETGVYRQRINNATGCDSIIDLDLLVIDKLWVDIDTSAVSLCADEEHLTINYSIMQGQFDSLLIMFDETGHAAGFTDAIITDNQTTTVEYTYSSSVVPGRYEVRLRFLQHKSCDGGVMEFALHFDIRYASSVLTQRWNDVIGIKNAQYNGGYEFSSYQWYKNGQAIPGETMPYLYASGGLDETAYYYVVLTRVSDGVEISTCPFMPQRFDSVQDMPTLLFTGDRIRQKNHGRAQWTDMQGRVLYTEHFTDATGVVVPELPAGYYMLNIQTEKETTMTKVRIIKN